MSMLNFSETTFSVILCEVPEETGNKLAVPLHERTQNRIKSGGKGVLIKAARLSTIRTKTTISMFGFPALS